MTEPGTMVHMAPSMMPSIKLNGFADACRRSCCAGEAPVYVKYENSATDAHIVGLTPTFPARIIPIDLNR